MLLSINSSFFAVLKPVLSPMFEEWKGGKVSLIIRIWLILFD